MTTGTPRRVAVLVGSLRKASLNRRFAEILAELASGSLDFDFVPLGDLPIYNDDLWADPPESVLRFKERIAAADAVLLVTPEYNRSIPPVLKNAIDWGSRPKDLNVWLDKPGAVAGASNGAIGTAVAQSHLRYVAGVVGIALLSLPEVYFSFRLVAVDAENRIADPGTRAFLTDFIARFAAWIELNTRVSVAD